MHHGPVVSGEGSGLPPAVRVVACTRARPDATLPIVHDKIQAMYYVVEAEHYVHRYVSRRLWKTG